MSTSLIGIVFAQFAVGIIGALFVTSEYSAGSIRTTLAAVPRRVELAFGKLIVLLVSMLIVSEVAAFAAFVMGQAIFSASCQRRHSLRSRPPSGRSRRCLPDLARGVCLFARPDPSPQRRDHQRLRLAAARGALDPLLPSCELAKRHPTIPAGRTRARDDLNDARPPRFRRVDRLRDTRHVRRRALFSRRDDVSSTRRLSRFAPPSLSAVVGEDQFPFFRQARARHLREHEDRPNQSNFRSQRGTHGAVRS